jgi:sugar lactone lactonase YvrE
MLDPTAENPTFDEVYTFPNVTLFGIAEVQPDVYGIIAFVPNVTTISAVPGTIAIWRVDLSSGGPPVVNKAADVPDGMFLDGLGAVPGEPDLVLGADTAAGRVWQINLRTGVVRIAAQDDAFAPGASAPAFGINGLHIRGGDLYFTNSQKKTFSRVPISVRGGNVAQAGPIQVLGSANGTDEFDDFVFDAAGRVWAATIPDTLTLFFPPAQGNGMLGQLNAPGNPVQFDSPTSAAFGRGGAAQQHTLYVTTQAGQLIAVDTTGIRV